MELKLTQEIIDAAIEGFESQKKRIDARIAELRSLKNGHAPVTEASRKRGGMSAAGRRAIAEAQRKRWAAKKAMASPSKPKRKLSAAGKAAIVAALKKRWAAKKAAVRAAKR